MRCTWGYVVGLLLLIPTHAADRPSDADALPSQVKAPSAGEGPSPGQASRIFMSRHEIEARMEQARDASTAGKPFRSAPLLQAGPFHAMMEYHTGPTDRFSIHEHDAELFVVLEGSGTITVGGKLVDPVRNGSNLTAAKIEGGQAFAVTKGEAVLVPEGSPHGVSGVDGKALVLMSLHLPDPPAAQASPRSTERP